MQERPDDLLLDHFWLLTSIGATAAPAKGTPCSLPPARHRRGSLRRTNGRARARAVLDTAHQAPLPRQPAAALPTSIDAAARNEAVLLLLLHLLAYELMHVGRRMMEIAAGTGWNLRRFRECVLRVGGRVLVHARRVTLVVTKAAARHWAALWPPFEHCAWPGT